MLFRSETVHNEMYYLSAKQKPCVRRETVVTSPGDGGAPECCLQVMLKVSERSMQVARVRCPEKLEFGQSFTIEMKPEFVLQATERYT
jgi:positive regulator of sigma E activity